MTYLKMHIYGAEDIVFCVLVSVVHGRVAQVAGCMSPRVFQASQFHRTMSLCDYELELTHAARHYSRPRR
eukprot:5692143-Amphidinium_carterae.2